MPTYVQIPAIALGLLLLLIMGFQDLRARYVKTDWMYIIILVCGIFSGGAWLEKLFCLLFVPAALIGVAYLRESKKAKREGRQPSIGDSIKQIGGADINLVGVVGFLVGPFVMAISILLCVLLGVPFLFNPNLGMKDADNSGFLNRKLPLVMLEAISLTLFYGFIWTLSAMK